MCYNNLTITVTILDQAISWHLSFALKTDTWNKHHIPVSQDAVIAHLWNSIVCFCDQNPRLAPYAATPSSQTRTNFFDAVNQNIQNFSVFQYWRLLQQLVKWLSKSYWPSFQCHQFLLSQSFIIPSISH
jgi:hypothetical protein